MSYNDEGRGYYRHSSVIDDLLSRFNKARAECDKLKHSPRKSYDTCEEELKSLRKFLYSDAFHEDFYQYK